MVRLGKALVFALCMGLVCCGPIQPQATTAPYGYLVIGPHAAAEFGLADGDTLGEHPSGTAPGLVVAAAQAAAAALRFDPECTRYFSRNQTFVALLKVRCDPGEVIEDGEALAAFHRGGQPAGALIPNLTQRDYTVLEPGIRVRGVNARAPGPDTLIPGPQKE